VGRLYTWHGKTWPMVGALVIAVHLVWQMMNMVRKDHNRQNQAGRADPGSVSRKF